MDPTVAHGNIFTTKGPLNHLVSEAWKNTVSREIRTERQWQASYNRKGLEKEQAWVDAALHQTQERQISPSRTLLPVTLRGAAGSKEDAEAKQRGLGLTRQELLGYHRSSNQQGTMNTASRDIGSRCSNRDNAVLLADRRTHDLQSSHGRKPVIASSFFRRSGVF